MAQRLVVAQLLDPRRTKEDEQEARHERDPHRDGRAEDSSEQRGQRTGVVVRGEEADELHDHDQRTRGCLGEPKPGDHVLGTNPAVVIHRLLRHVPEDRVGAAEGEHRSLGEHHGFLGEHVVHPEHQGQCRDGN